MTSSEAIDQEILNDLRNGKKVEPKLELKPIVDRIVDRAIRKVNSMSREELEEFEKSTPDPLRKLFEDLYIPLEPKEQ